MPPLDGFTTRQSGIVVPESNSDKGKQKLIDAFAMTLDILVKGFQQAFPEASLDDAREAAGHSLIGPIASQTFIEILSQKLV